MGEILRVNSETDQHCYKRRRNQENDEVECHAIGFVTWVSMVHSSCPAPPIISNSEVMPIANTAISFGLHLCTHACQNLQHPICMIMNAQSRHNVQPSKNQRVKTHSSTSAQSREPRCAACNHERTPKKTTPKDHKKLTTLEIDPCLAWLSSLEASLENMLA